MELFFNKIQIFFLVNSKSKEKINILLLILVNLIFVTHGQNLKFTKINSLYKLICYFEKKSHLLEK
jgi:hypothetical protein